MKRVQIEALDNESNSFISIFEGGDVVCFIHIQPDNELVEIEYPLHGKFEVHYLPAEIDLDIC